MPKLSTKLADSLAVDEDGKYGVAPALLEAIEELPVSDAVSSFAWSSNAATCNLANAKNFAASNTMTGNSTLTLSNGADGMNGMLLVKQDATGGRTLAFTIAGRTVLKDLNVADTNPFAAANAITMYQYFYVTIAGTASVVLNKVYLQ